MRKCAESDVECPVIGERNVQKLSENVQKLMSRNYIEQMRVSVKRIILSVIGNF